MNFVSVYPPEQLPGVKKQSFSMAFGGGEIWFEHLDGMYQYTDYVLRKLEKDSKTFLRPSFPSLISINLDQTQINESIENAIISKITNPKKQFTRCVFTGLDRHNQRRMKNLINKSGAGFALNFINDFEKAKEWLVSEKNI